MVRAPRTGVTEGVFPSDLDFIEGVGLTVRAVVRGSRTPFLGALLHQL